jgi:two-component system response regulator AtoC
MSKAQVLVVDDDTDVREFLGTVLDRQGARVSFARDGRQALARLEQRTVEVLFTDLCMPNMDGLTLLREARQIHPELSVVVFTAYAKLDSCIEAMRAGASDYVTKPFTSKTIHAALARALDSCKQKTPAVALHPQTSGMPAVVGRIEAGDEPLVARSSAMREVCRLVDTIAPTDVPVLVRGESGVGKEQVARAIHRQGRRGGGPFVSVLCDAVREAELDDKLFGRQAGLGGEAPLHGRFLESAQGGTIYLANVDCLPLWAQVQLFDAFQRGGFHGFAGGPPPLLDVRVIASTSCGLEAAVAEGRFHDGLYYVFSAVSIPVPPLRERRQDIKILAERCLAQAIAGQGVAGEKNACRFTAEAWECLLDHDWPGNLPELAGVVVHAVAQAGGKAIGKDAIARLAHKAHRGSAEMISVPMAGTIGKIERYIIEEVLHRCRGNKAAAARALGLHRRTLYRMLEEDAGDTGRSESP